MPKNLGLGSVIAIALLLTMGAGCKKAATTDSGPATAPNTAPITDTQTEPRVSAGSIEIKDQSIKEDGPQTLVVAQAIIPRGGWVVIHQENQGAPGPVVGHAALKQGTNEKITVALDKKINSGSFLAMLHNDEEPIGTYEFPGQDVPLIDLNKPVMAKFLVTITKEEKPAVIEDKKPTSPSPAPESKAPAAPETKELPIIAKQWSFTPNTITIKKGTRVRLKITSTDVSHGFSLPAFNVETTLEPGKTSTLEFTADKTGTHTFFCSVFCGQGHGAMSGKIIVE